MATKIRPWPMTLEEYAALPEDDGSSDELVCGWVVSEPRPTDEHGLVAAHLTWLLKSYAHRLGSGKVYSNDSGFILSRGPDTLRGPDVAYVSEGRFREAGVRRGWFPGPPDLAVEVRSPSQRQGELRGKIADYLVAGTKMVWIVDPRERTVTVYRSFFSPRVLGEGDHVDGEDVLPGFRVAVAEVFAV